MNSTIKLTTRPKLVQEDIIQKLEDALVKARDGHIVGIAMVYITDDGAIGSGYSRSDEYSRLLGAVTLLQHRLCAE